MHRNSILLFEKYAKDNFRPNMKVIEIGPDKFPSTYQSIIGNSGIDESKITWHTVDIYEDPSLTYTALSEYAFPIEDNAYDMVLSAQVIEHVRKPWIWMKELSRICKPGGMVVTINPVSWPYHEAPIDCWRAYPEGMIALYEDALLSVVMSKWESLESTGYQRYVSGRSREQQKGFSSIAYKLLCKAGFPFERSYDTITIGKKGIA